MVEGFAAADGAGCFVIDPSAAVRNRGLAGRGTGLVRRPGHRASSIRPIRERQPRHLDALRSTFGDKIAPFQMRGRLVQFTGYVDLVHRKAATAPQLTEIRYRTTHR